MGNNKIISHPVAKTLVYTNLFMAICAFAQVLMTYVLFDIPFEFRSYSYLLFIFLSTYLQYNMQRGQSVFQEFFQRLAVYLKHKVWIQPQPIVNMDNERQTWFHKNRNFFLVSNLIALITLLFLCNWLSWTSIYIMIGAEVVSTLYYMKPFYLRRYGYFKPFLISAIWAISCVLVPLMEFSTVSNHSVYFIAAKFLFIAELCVVFDINDSEKDFQSGVYTYANKLGLSFTKIFCIVLLAGSGVLYGLFVKQALPIIFAAVFLVLCGVISLLSNNKKHSFFYYLLIDGLMILQPIFYLIPWY